MARASKPNVPTKSTGDLDYASEMNAVDTSIDAVIDDYVSQTDTTNQPVASNLIFGVGKGPDALGTKKIDEAAIADGKVVMYKSASGKLEFDTPPGGGGASDVATYITKDDETVALPNSVRHQNIVDANKHTPLAHTHLEADVTDLDHDAAKIGTKVVDLAGMVTGHSIRYDGVKFVADTAFLGAPTFTIYKDGANTVRKDQDGNATSGADARTIIQGAITALGTTGGWIHVKKGVYDITGTAIIVNGATINCLKLTGEGWSRATAADGTFFKLTDNINCIEITNDPQVDFQDFAVDCNNMNGHGIKCYPQGVGDYVIEGGWFNNLYIRGVKNNGGTYYAGMYIEGAMYWAIGRIIIDCNYGGHGIWINNPYADKSRGSSTIYSAYIRLYGTTGSAIKATSDLGKPSGNYWMGWIELYGREQWEATTHYGFDLDQINHWTISHAVLESLNKCIVMDNCKSNNFLGGYITAGGSAAIDLTANANNNVFRAFWAWSNIGAGVPKVINDLGTDNCFEDIRGGTGYNTANTYAATTELRGIIANGGSDEHVADVVQRTATSVDLSGGATDIICFHTEVACKLIKASLLYTEASSGDAGVVVRIGKESDDNYYYTGTSEINQAQWYTKDVTLLQTDIAAGDTVTLGTAGAKVGTGEIMLIIEVALLH